MQQDLHFAGKTMIVTDIAKANDEDNPHHH
jgi:hypothetical protein